MKPPKVSEATAQLAAELTFAVTKARLEGLDVHEATPIFAAIEAMADDAASRFPAHYRELKTRLRLLRESLEPKIETVQ